MCVKLSIVRMVHQREMHETTNQPSATCDVQYSRLGGSESEFLAMRKDRFLLATLFEEKVLLTCSNRTAGRKEMCTQTHLKDW